MAWRYSTYLYCTISLMSLTPIHRFRVVRQACCKIARNRNLLWVATSLLHTPECFFSCHNLLQISKYFPYLFVETIGDFPEKQEVQVVWRVRKLQAHSRSLQRKVKKMYLETFIRTKKNQLWQWNTSSLALEYKESGDVFRPRRLQRAHSVTGIAWLSFDQSRCSAAYVWNSCAKSNADASRSWILRFCGDLNAKMYGKLISFVS